MRTSEARSRAGRLSHLNLFIELTEEDGPGEAVAVKDLIDVRGTATTGGGAILPIEPRRRDAPLIEAIRDHGCTVVGKANLHEWAFGATGVNPHHGTVVNPRDERRIAGGSSSGSAAAVAAGVCDWAIGTDTGGSIRIPAALCGVVGFKPSLGTISTVGVLPLSASLDTVGSLAPDVATAARAVGMMAQRTGLDDLPEIDDGRLRLAVPAGWVDNLDAEVARAWAGLARDLPSIAFPPRAELSRACLDIMLAEAASVHRGWIAGCPELYGPDLLERLRGAFEVSAADYVDALSNRDRVRAEVARAMDGVDAILLPTTAAVAPLHVAPIDTEPLTGFTRPFNYTGQPVFSLPAPGSGLPVGVQVVGRIGRERELAMVALALEARWAAR